MRKFSGIKDGHKFCKIVFIRFILFEKPFSLISPVIKNLFDFRKLQAAVILSFLQF